MSFVSLKNAKITDEPKHKVKYDSSYFGFQRIHGDGKFVRICIIDSGSSDHDDIKFDESKIANFTKEKNAKDDFGHATAIAGIIAANNSNKISGMANQCDLYFAKVIDRNNIHFNANAVSEALLWSLVKDVDIVLMSIGSKFANTQMHDAIKKVYNSGIPIISAAGDCSHQTHDVLYPARYREVFSVGYQINDQIIRLSHHQNDCVGVILPNIKFSTTFLNSKFVELEGSSFGAAAVAGLAILAYQNIRRRGFNPKNPQMLYNEIGKLMKKY